MKASTLISGLSLGEFHDHPSSVITLTIAPTRKRQRHLAHSRQHCRSGLFFALTVLSFCRSNSLESSSSFHTC